MISSYSRNILVLAVSAVCLLLTSGCSDSVTPKPRGYFRIVLPEHSYQQYNADGMPFSFEHSSMSRIIVDNNSTGSDEWLNIDYPSLKCKIHVTYLRLTPSQEEMAYEDNHRLLYKHTVAADAIVGRFYDDNDRNIHAAMYEVKGNAATPAQFSITDSLGQVFRGSLYFFCHPNKDSLAPVVTYVDEDINHLIESFNWK